jgi:hypothetical protein
MISDDERIKLLEEAQPNSWIALSSDESKVVGRGDTYAAAVADADKHGEKDPILIKTPNNWQARVLVRCG